MKSYLIEQTEKLAFNDKNKEAFKSAILFEHFYRSVDEKIYTSEMHSNTQFCVNRSGVLLPNITHMVSNFSFKMTNETAAMLSYQLVTKDQLTSNTSDVYNLFKTVCERVEEP